MKWFIKCLRHYADFSGRARRKEYWMFVLFNFIFALVWQISMLVVFILANSGNPVSLKVASNVAGLSYGILIMLPSMAVAVRRLHDIGKSGWMLLIGLIPIIGGIWLFVLMVTEGQQEDNKYGDNPKISLEIFSDSSKLKSAGIVLVVACSIALIVSIIFSWIVPAIYQNSHFLQISFLVPGIISFAATIMLLIVGFFLLNKKAILKIQEKKNNVIILLLIAVSISLVLGVLYLINSLKFTQIMGWNFTINQLSLLLSYLLFALFVVSILFSQSQELVSKAAAIAIIFLSLHLLWNVYLNMYINTRGGDRELIYQLQNLFGTLYILRYVALIVLAGTFYEKLFNEGKE